ncbi:MAG: RnfABCDGE type electron transport complex subunit G [Candidatus Omnitrophota bacterium]
MMLKSLKMIVVLTLAGLLSGGFLTVVYKKTLPEIEKRRLEALQEAIFVVLPQAVDYKETEIEGENFYQGIDKNGQDAGIAFLVKGPGFQGEIKMMVGITQDLSKLQNIYILESIETPGLGGKITGDDFQRQFKGLSIKDRIELIKRGRGRRFEAAAQEATVEAITGATISSRAVVDMINRKIARVKEVLARGE